MFGINIVQPVDMGVRRELESTTGSNRTIDAIGFSIGDIGKFQVLRNLFEGRLSRRVQYGIQIRA